MPAKMTREQADLQLSEETVAMACTMRNTSSTLMGGKSVMSLEDAVTSCLAIQWPQGDDCPSEACVFDPLARIILGYCQCDREAEIRRRMKVKR